jgi:hypothetical protein
MTATTIAGPRLADDVLLLVQDESARIADLGRGRFYGLDPLSTRFLTLALEFGPERAAERVAGEHEVPVEGVRADLRDLLTDLTRKGVLAGTGRRRAWGRGLLLRAARWLVGGALTVRRLWARPGRQPSRRAVSCLLTLAWLSFRLFGWGPTLRLWARWHRIAPLAPEQVEEAARAVDEAVRAAASGHLFLPMVCKERALVGWQLLRAIYGAPARLVLGVERHPFRAHAWAECAGRVVTDDAGHCEPFAPIASY